jgi:hypothetical protein
LLKFLFFSFLILLLQSCSAISQNFGFYKLSAGSYETTREQDNEAIELKYKGKENESIDEAVEKWHQGAFKECSSHYKVVSGNIFSSPVLKKGTNIIRLESLYIYFAEENEKWPQVIGFLKC